MKNWNNLINYIKTKLGTHVNLIEFTDDDIISYIKENTLLEFSQHIPKKKWILLSDSNLVLLDNNHNNQTYRIPLEDDEIIVDVYSVYYSNTNTGVNNFNAYFTNPVDLVMSSSYQQMIEKLNPIQNYQFISPDILRFGFKNNSRSFIVELNVVHHDIDQIQLDVYNDLLKPMALKDIIENIIANRSKYESLQSPFGEVNLNIQYLETMRDKLEQKIDDEKSWNPPKYTFEIF